MQESLLLAHLRPKQDIVHSEGQSESQLESESSGVSDVESDDEDDQLTRLLQVIDHSEAYS